MRRNDPMREVRWFNSALLLLFIGLKLGGLIDWSWWWVLAPFWIPVAALALSLMLHGLAWLLMSPEQRNAERLKRAFAQYSEALTGRRA